MFPFPPPPIFFIAWVRGKRKDPPSEDEIFTREAKEQIIKKRAAEVERRDQEVSTLKCDQGSK